MSFEHVAIVMNHSAATGSARNILIGIASHANELGEAYPGMMKLAQYANFEGWDAEPVDDSPEAKKAAQDARASARRSAIRAVQKLEALGEVVVETNGGGTYSRPDHTRPNLYTITLACPPTCDHSAQHRKRSPEATRDALLAGMSGPVDNPPADPVAPAPPRGTSATTPVAPAPPEPSDNHQPKQELSESKTGTACAREAEPEDNHHARRPLGDEAANAYRKRIDAKALKRRAANAMAQSRTPDELERIRQLRHERCPADPRLNHLILPSLDHCARPGCTATITEGPTP